MLDTESFKKARMLIVDDQPANVRLLQEILRRAGYANVTGTTDPRQALGLFLEFEPDLMILDLHMPHIDGFALMEAMGKQIPEDTYFPILVLTADTTPDARQRALSMGAKDFLTKPFDATEAVLRIRNLLETRFLHLQLVSQTDLLEERVKERTRELTETLANLQKLSEQRRVLLSRLADARGT